MEKGVMSASRKSAISSSDAELLVENERLSDRAREAEKRLQVKEVKEKDYILEIARLTAECEILSMQLIDL